MKRAVLNNFVVLSLFLLPALPSPASLAQENAAGVEEVVVIGRQPGPKMWKVTNGENTLWILPLVSIVPRDMSWDDDKVAAIIAEADEAISEPNVTVGVAKSVMLNPINIVRAMRLFKRLGANPDGATLAQVLPPALYQRYAALKTAHFPRDRNIDTMRPSSAADAMFEEVLTQQQLTSSRDIIRQVERHIRRNHDLTRTDVTLVQTVQGSYRELSKRIETMTESLPREREIACFEQQLRILENHLDDMKAVASAWAGGQTGFSEDYLPEATDDQCTALLLDSTEGELLQQTLLESRQRWIDAATSALMKNPSTFAVLPMAQITGAASLVEELAARGYLVDAPR
jgi:hypothetical protein